MDFIDDLKQSPSELEVTLLKSIEEIIVITKNLALLKAEVEKFEGDNSDVGGLNSDIAEQMMALERLQNNQTEIISDYLSFLAVSSADLSPNAGYDHPDKNKRDLIIASSITAGMASAKVHPDEKSGFIVPISGGRPFDISKAKHFVTGFSPWVLQETVYKSLKHAPINFKGTFNPLNQLDKDIETTRVTLDKLKSKALSYQQRIEELKDKIEISKINLSKAKKKIEEIESKSGTEKLVTNIKALGKSLFAKEGEESAFIEDSIRKLETDKQRIVFTLSEDRRSLKVNKDKLDLTNQEIIITDENYQSLLEAKEAIIELLERFNISLSVEGVLEKQVENEVDNSLDSIKRFARKNKMTPEKDPQFIRSGHTPSLSS